RLLRRALRLPEELRKQQGLVLRSAPRNASGTSPCSFHPAMRPARSRPFRRVGDPKRLDIPAPADCLTNQPTASGGLEPRRIDRFREVSRRGGTVDSFAQGGGVSENVPLGGSARLAPERARKQQGDRDRQQPPRVHIFVG